MTSGCTSGRYRCWLRSISGRPYTVQLRPVVRLRYLSRRICQVSRHCLSQDSHQDQDRDTNPSRLRRLGLPPTCLVSSPQAWAPDHCLLHGRFFLFNPYRFYIFLISVSTPLVLSIRLACSALLLTTDDARPAAPLTASGTAAKGQSAIAASRGSFSASIFLYLQAHQS